MQVGHRLAAVVPRIEDRSIPAIAQPLRVGDVAGGEKDLTEEVAVVVARRCEGCHVSPRNHEDVSGCLWVDVAKSEQMLAPVDDVGGNLAGGDPAEEATGVVHEGLRLVMRRGARDPPMLSVPGARRNASKGTGPRDASLRSMVTPEGETKLP